MCFYCWLFRVICLIWIFPSNTHCKYILPVSGLPFHFLDIVFQGARLCTIDKGHLIKFILYDSCFDIFLQFINILDCLGWEDPLEKEMATKSSIFAWRIPWTEEPGRLQPMGLQRVRQDWATKHSTAHPLPTKMSLNVFLLLCPHLYESIMALTLYMFIHTGITSCVSYLLDRKGLREDEKRHR